MNDKLSIANEMKMFDHKVRDFYDDLSDDERKKFAPFLMIRWGSAVEGSRDLQEFYVISTNERLNKNFFNINSTRHRKLHWLMATSVSPGLGAMRHNWIAPKKKEAGAGSMKKQLAELFPHYKSDEIDVMAAITTKKELDQYIRQHGRDTK
jgi:hypothetical protein